MNDRDLRIRTAILEELYHAPTEYMLNERTIHAGVRLAVCPEPSAGEFSRALKRLEADGMVHCEPSALKGNCWKITPSGSAALAE